MLRIILPVLAAAALAAPVRAAVYEIDPVHSTVGFKVRHMVVAKTTGKFKQVSGEIHYDPETKPEMWKARATIDAASIDTENAKRDDHLRGEDFFHVEKYPTLEFESAKVTEVKEGRAKLHGKLTLHGVTRDIVLDLEIHGVAGARAGFSAATTIDRTDYGINWNRVLDTGGVAVGKMIEISLEIEALDKALDKAKQKR